MGNLKSNKKPNFASVDDFNNARQLAGQAPNLERAAEITALVTKRLRHLQSSDSSSGANTSSTSTIITRSQSSQTTKKSKPTKADLIQELENTISELDTANRNDTHQLQLIRELLREIEHLKTERPAERAESYRIRAETAEEALLELKQKYDLAMSENQQQHRGGGRLYTLLISSDDLKRKLSCLHKEHTPKPPTNTTSVTGSRKIARRQRNEAEADTEDEQLPPNCLFERGTNEDSNNKAVEEERQQCILALSKAEEQMYLLEDEMLRQMEEQRNAFEDELRMKLTQKVN